MFLQNRHKSHKDIHSPFSLKLNHAELLRFQCLQCEQVRHYFVYDSLKIHLNIILNKSDLLCNGCQHNQRPRFTLFVRVVSRAAWANVFPQVAAPCGTLCVSQCFRRIYCDLHQEPSWWWMLRFHFTHTLRSIRFGRAQPGMCSRTMAIAAVELITRWHGNCIILSS